MIKTLSKLNQLRQRLEQQLLAVITWISLLAIYFIGIGPTSLFAKIIRKDFLNSKNNNDSSWHDANYKSAQLEKQY